MLIAAEELRRNGVRKSEGADGTGADGALGAFAIDDDADDLNVRRRFEQFENLLGVGHLRNGCGRDEADCIDVGESGMDKAAKVSGLGLRRDDRRQPLPGVARALDEFDHLIAQPATPSAQRTILFFSRLRDAMRGTSLKKKTIIARIPA